MFKQDIATQLGGRIRFTRFVITYKDLQALGVAATGAQAINLTDQVNPSNTFLIPPTNGVAGGAKILGIAVKTSTAFGGGALTALTMSVGVTGALTRFTAAFDIFQAIGDTVLQETAMFKLGQYSPAQLVVNFIPTTDVVANATAGQLFLDICWLDNSTTFTEPA